MIVVAARAVKICPIFLDFLVNLCMVYLKGSRPAVFKLDFGFWD